MCDSKVINILNEFLIFDISKIVIEYATIIITGFDKHFQLIDEKERYTGIKITFDYTDHLTLVKRDIKTECNGVSAHELLYESIENIIGLVVSKIEFLDELPDEIGLCYDWIGNTGYYLKKFCRVDLTSWKVDTYVVLRITTDKGSLDLIIYKAIYPKSVQFEVEINSDIEIELNPKIHGKKFTKSI